MTNKLRTVAAAVRGAAFALRAVGALALLAPAAAGAATEKKPELTAKCAKGYKPAFDAYQKNDLDNALTLATQGQEVCGDKPYDTQQILMLIRSIYSKQKNYPAMAETIEKINAMDITTDADRVQTYGPMTQIYASQKQWDKAAEYGVKWANSGGGAQAYELMWKIYLNQGDCEHGLPWLEKAVADHEPAEAELLQLNRCYYKLEKKAERKAVMEQLVRRFMKHDNVNDLLAIYEEEKIDPRAKLNLRRLEFLKNYMTRESEYVDYSDAALDVGSPNEALTVLTQGQQQGIVKFIAATDHNSRMLAQAKTQSADDKKQVAALDREAQAGKNGEADVKVGLVYLGLGDYQKAVDAISRGLSADRVARVKRVDDANMMLGIANWKLGKVDEAKAAFTAAKADPRMANAARVWIESL